MDDPPIGQNVDVVLSDGSTTLAYWNGSSWWVGVENDPLDAPLSGTVIGWSWRAD